MQRGTRALSGVGLVVGGALIGMLAITVLPWYRSDFGGILPNGSSVSDIRTTISFYESQPNRLQDLFSLGVSPEYFGGLAFVLLLVAALAGFVGAGMTGLAGRIAAASAVVIGVAGVVLTAFAVRFVAIDAIRTVDTDGTARSTTPPTYGDFVSHTTVGAWAMVLAYVLVGVGAFLAAGSREELRELLRDDFDDEPVDEPVDATVDAPEPPVLTKRTDDVW